MSEQAKRNKSVLDRTNEIINSGDTSAVDELFAEEFVEHNPMPGVGADRDGFRQMVETLHAAFPDFETEIHRQIAEGEYVVEHWTSTGTHEGEFFGVPATGRRVTVEGMDISRIVDGRLVEHWTQMDALGMMEQLGVIGSEQQATA